MSDRVNMLDMDTIRDIQADGSIIQNGFYARFYQLVGHFLCGRGGDGQHGKLNLVLLYFFSHDRRIKNFEGAHFLPYLLGIVIEYHPDLETAIGKSVIAGEGVSHVTHAYDDNIPTTIYFQDISQPLDEEGN